MVYLQAAALLNCHTAETFKKEYSYSYSYFIEFMHQTCMKQAHDNVHKRYSDKTIQRY